MAAPPPPPPPPPPIATDFAAPPAPIPAANHPQNTLQQPTETQAPPQSAPNPGNGEKLWERAWSIGELRESSSKWNLAADAGLLLYLQQFSQRMVSQTHELEKQVDGVVSNTKGLHSKVQNTVNDFLMLSNSQFIENRVYEEDLSKDNQQENIPGTDAEPSKEKPREQREEDVIPRISEALKHGIGVLDNAFITLELVTEHDSDEEQDAAVQTKYNPQPILEPKDLYVHRPMPHLIGTADFYTDDLVGLGESESEDEGGADEEEEEASESESEAASSESGSEESGSESSASSSESESDSSIEDKKLIVKKQKKKKVEVSSSEDEDEDLFGDKKKTKDESEEEEDESGEEAVPSKPAAGPMGFAAELASKIGVAPPRPANSDEEDAEPGAWSDKEQNTGKEVPQEKPRSETSRSRSGSKGKKDMHHHKKGRSRTKSGEKHSRKRHDSKTSKASAAQGDDLFAQPSGGDDGLFSTDGSLFAKKGGLFSGGGGLFDDDGDKEGGLFGDEAKTEPSAEKDASEKEEEEEAMIIKPRARSTASGKKIPAGAVSIFGEGFLSGSPTKQESVPSTPEDKPSRKDTKKGVTGGGGLFDEDEDGGLFNSTAKDSIMSYNISLIQTGVVLIAEVVQSDKRKPVKTVDLFGGDEEEHEDDLFAGKSAAAPPKKKMPAGAVPMFGGSPPTKKETHTPSESKPTPEKQPSKPKLGGGLFSDEDEEEGGAGLFAATKPKQQPAAQNKPKAKTTISLFDDDDQDDDDDFFSAPPVKPAAANSKKEAKTDSAKEEKPKPASSGLFDADEDMFDSPAPTRKAAGVPKQAKQPNPESKMPSLFSDEEDEGMFGGGADDIFEASSPKKPDSKSVSKKTHTSTQDNSSATSKPAAKKPSLFSDEEEDLFSDKPAEQPAPAEPQEPETKKPWKPVGGVSLFGGVDMFSGKKPSFTGSESSEDAPDTVTKVKAPEPKPQQKVFTSDDDDDFFDKPQPPPLSANTTPAPAATQAEPAPVPAAPPSKAKAGPSLFSDDEDDLFSTSKEELPPLPSPEKPKPRKPAGAVSMFGGVDLFGGGSSPKAIPVTKKPTATAIKDPLGGLFNDQEEEDGLFAAKPKPKPQSTVSPRPVPKPAAAKPSPPTRISPSTVQPSPPSTSPAASTVEPSTPSTSPAVSSAKPGSAIGKLQKSLAFNPAMLRPDAAPPRRDVESSVASLDEPVQQKTLQNVGKERARIQVKRRPPTRHARRAGAVASASDETLFGPSLTPDSAPPLTSVDDSFITRIQVDSVPDHPALSRKGTRDSDISDDFFGFSSSKSDQEKSMTSTASDRNPPISDGMPPPVKAATSAALFAGDSDLFCGSTTKQTTESNTEKRTINSKPAALLHDDLFSSAPKKQESAKTNAIPPRIKDDNLDLFASSSEQARVQTQKTTVEKKSVLEDDNLFASTPKTSTTKTTGTTKKETNGISPLGDDLFASAPKITGTTSTKKESTDKSPLDDDLFASAAKTSKTTGTTKKETTNKYPLDDDLFASSTPKESKDNTTHDKNVLPLDDTDDLFATGATKKTQGTPQEKEGEKKGATKNAVTRPPLDDDDDDLFTVKKTDRKPRKVVKPLGDDDLFGDSGNIFADVPSKPKEKKKKKSSAAAADSIFDDQQTTPEKTTKKTKVKKKTGEKKSLKAASIFDDDAPSIFDDPLNATSSK